jgi:hypothetical protein
VHLNTGFAHTSWSGEVRAVLIEDRVAVVRRWLTHKRYWAWVVLDELDFTYMPRIRMGRLPAAVRKNGLQP